MRRFAILLSLCLASSVVFAQSDYLRDDKILPFISNSQREFFNSLQARAPLLQREVLPISCGLGMYSMQERRLVYLYPHTSPTAPDKIVEILKRAATAVNQTIDNSQSGAYRSRLAAIRPISHTPGATLFEDITAMYNSGEVSDILLEYGPNVSIGLWVEGPVTDGLTGVSAGGYGSSLPHYHIIRLNDGDPHAIGTSVHEWGHGIGTNHQKNDPRTDPNAKPSFAFGWVDPGDGENPGRTDIMAVWLPGMCPMGCPRQFVFSNSNLGMGVPGESENYLMVGIAYADLGSDQVCVPIDTGVSQLQ